LSSWLLARTASLITAPENAGGGNDSTSQPAPGNNRDDIREFPDSRRAGITPQQAGLIAYGRTGASPACAGRRPRCWPGSASATTPSPERGKLTGVSDTVLDAIADTLQLDEAERAHLFDLARATNAAPRTRRRADRQQVRPGVQRILSATDGPKTRSLSAWRPRFGARGRAGTNPRECLRNT
jgi:hypothetical protein